MGRDILFSPTLANVAQTAGRPFVSPRLSLLHEGGVKSSGHESQRGLKTGPCVAAKNPKKKFYSGLATYWRDDLFLPRGGEADLQV